MALNKRATSFWICLAATVVVLLGLPASAPATPISAAETLVTTLPDPKATKATVNLPIEIAGLKSNWARPGILSELYNLMDQMVSDENRIFYLLWLRRPDTSLIPVTKVTLYVFHEVSAQTFFDSPAQSAARAVPLKVPLVRSIATVRLTPKPDPVEAFGARSELVLSRPSELEPGDILREWSGGVDPREYGKRVALPPPPEYAPGEREVPVTEQQAAQRVWQMQSELGEAQLPKPPAEEGVGAWLMSETGLFSGEPWGAANFLPRLLTIGGLVILFLLAVELLRIMFGAGAKIVQQGLRRTRKN